jgi:hypothetical protein
MKPRVNFCWNCGAKLHGNNFKEVEIDGEYRTIHKTCSMPDRETIDPRCGNCRYNKGQCDLLGGDVAEDGFCDGWRK